MRQLRVELEAAKGEKVEVRASGCWELTSARRWLFGNGLELRFFLANDDIERNGYDCLKAIKHCRKHLRLMPY